MKTTLIITCFILNFFVQSYGQVNCDDYRIVSIFDIPASPQTPGGNYFLLLLTLDEDNLSNFDNYASLYFVDALGDTISIPTGGSFLPRYASDTIPYILQLNSASSNQDFPEDFNGELRIRHITELICEVAYSNISTSTNIIHEEVEINIFPNPFVDCIKIDSDQQMDRILIVGSDGRMADKYYPDSNSQDICLKKLSVGEYFIVIHFEGGKSRMYKVLKI